MAEIIKMFERIKGDYNSEKEHPEKFIQTLEFAEAENLELLDSKNIKLKPSQWIVLSIEPEILAKTVLRAEELGFLEAYQQNPAFLKHDVDAIIKRMAELEHLGIPYKNEKGKYQSFLFSNRGYSYVLGEHGHSNNKEDAENLPSITNVELKEAADRVMETFALTDEKDAIYRRLIELEHKGFSLKEALIEVFKGYSDNLDFLSLSIDEILSANEEMAKGRVA